LELTKVLEKEIAELHTLTEQAKKLADNKKKEAELKKKADEERKQKEAEARKAKEEQRRVGYLATAYSLCMAVDKKRNIHQL
jgi:prophage antirepressor-like protein